MPLQAIDFKTAADVKGVLDRLVKSKAIELIKQDGKTRIRCIQPNYLLKASDGEIYLLTDVQNYIETASKEDIADSTITFETTGAEKFTLAQIKIKADESIINRLRGADEAWEYIKHCNPLWYSDLSLPSLETVEDIEGNKTLYDNSTLNSCLISSQPNSSWAKLKADQEQLQTNLLCYKIIQSAETLVKTSAKLKPPKLPELLNSSDFITTMHKDFLKVTVLQGIEIKRHLLRKRNEIVGLDKIEEALANEAKITQRKMRQICLKETKTLSEVEQAKVTLLTQWIEDIYCINSAANKNLNETLASLKNHNDKIKSIKSKYSQLKQKNTSLDDIQKNIETLNQNAEALRESISRWELLSLLKPMAFYFIVSLPPLLIVGALLTIALLVHPIVAVLVTATLAAVFTTTFKVMPNSLFIKIAKAYESITKAIEDGFDYPLKNKRSELEKAEKTLQNLQNDWVHLKLHEEGDDKLKEFLLATPEVNHDALIEALVSNLKEIDIVEAKPTTLPITRRASDTFPVVSHLSKFKQPKNSSKSEEERSDSEDKEKDLILTTSSIV